MKAFYFVAAVALLGQVYLARAIDVTSPEATLAAGLAINALNTKYPARLDGVISADKQIKVAPPRIEITLKFTASISVDGNTWQPTTCWALVSIGAPLNYAKGFGCTGIGDFYESAGIYK